MHTRPLLTLTLSLFGLTGCYGTDAMLSGAEMGVTQGGVQDMNHARDIIAGGYIPLEGSFTSEGLFSEHDLPIEGVACDQILCPRAAASTIRTTDGAEEGILIQLGFGTSISAESFSRRDINMAVVVDVSGSMSGTKMTQTKAALREIVDQLTEADIVALVAFDNTAKTLLSPRHMDREGRESLRGAIARLQPDGGTNMESGIERGIAIVRENLGGRGVEDRVLMLTDAQPNVASTQPQTFVGMATAASMDNIGLTLVGVGMDLGVQVLTAISEVRGGNAVVISNSGEIEESLIEDFDMMVTPLAYDLEVTVTPSQDLEFSAGYGIAIPGPAASLEFGASTLFLSRRDGGMGAVLRPMDGEGARDEMVHVERGELASFDIRYEKAETGELVAQTLDVNWEGGDAHQAGPGLDPHADDLGVFKMALLIDEVHALDAGAAFCAGRIERSEATRIVRGVAEKLDMAAPEDGEDKVSFLEEVALLDRLAENIEGGRDNCF